MSSDDAEPERVVRLMSKGKPGKLDVLPLCSKGGQNARKAPNYNLKHFYAIKIDCRDLHRWLQEGGNPWTQAKERSKTLKKSIRNTRFGEAQTTDNLWVGLF